jgi:hypothetical protein
MISSSDLVHLPYTSDLTEGGIACALHSLPSTYPRAGASPYDHLRRAVAAAAVELAFRRHLSERKVPFDVKGAAPFTAPDRYDVVLGGRRCEIQSFLISHRDQISKIKQDPQIVLRAPALVASDYHAGDGRSPRDLYLFAFLAGLVAASQMELQEVIETGQPHYLVHAMPGAWNRPVKWSPLGKLALKSEAEEEITIELGGQAEGREMRTCTLALPPRQRVEVECGLFSLAYVHTRAKPDGRVGIHSPTRNETHIIPALDWGNIWVYGLEILLAGYITQEEFRRRASFIQAGSRVFQYDQLHAKNLALPISELQTLSDLFERARAWNSTAD